MDRKTELADLDTHLKAIQTAFLRSLELNENAEQRKQQKWHAVKKAEEKNKKTERFSAPFFYFLLVKK